MSNEDKNEVLTQLRIAIAELKVSFDLKFDANAHALLLQAQEYERRLSALNHEAAQLKEMQATYVPRETYDVLVEKIEHLQTFKDRALGSSSVVAVSSAISLLTNVAFLLLGR